MSKKFFDSWQLWEKMVFVGYQPPLYHRYWQVVSIGSGTWDCKICFASVNIKLTFPGRCDRPWLPQTDIQSLEASKVRRYCSDEGSPAARNTARDAAGCAPANAASRARGRKQWPRSTVRDSCYRKRDRGRWSLDIEVKYPRPQSTRQSYVVHICGTRLYYESNLFKLQHIALGNTSTGA